MNDPLMRQQMRPQTIQPLKGQVENRVFPVRFPMAETLALLLILVAGVLAIIGIAILSGQLELGAPDGSSGESARVLSSAQAAGVVERAESLATTSAGASGASGASGEWVSLLQSDPNALGVFILRTLTTSGYLSRQKDDQAFS